jgi:hypothetical protein
MPDKDQIYRLRTRSTKARKWTTVALTYSEVVAKWWVRMSDADYEHSAPLCTWQGNMAGRRIVEFIRDLIDPSHFVTLLNTEGEKVPTDGVACDGIRLNNTTIMTWEPWNGPGEKQAYLRILTTDEHGVYAHTADMHGWPEGNLLDLLLTCNNERPPVFAVFDGNTMKVSISGNNGKTTRGHHLLAGWVTSKK